MYLILISTFSSADNRPFRLSGGSGNMEKVVRMDKVMTRVSTKSQIYKVQFEHIHG